MIKKLSQRIFLIIMISLSVVVLGVIVLFGVLNYRNTINTATLMIDRVTDVGIRKDERVELDRVNPNINIDGLYHVVVTNSKIINNSASSYDKEIEDYAIKISSRNKESGIIGKYIYKMRKTKQGTSIISFMENEKAILDTKIILIFSGVLSGLSLIAIYIVAKKVSKIIVKPVEETFEKQKQFISDASHELKTPLAVIEANADVLENEIGKNKWINYIQNEIESMDKLVNELLLLTKIENVNDFKDYKEFDLSKEVEIIISMFESMAYEKGVNIHSNIQENITMNGNKEDIKHILSTLIDNAIKHTESEKEVTIELSKEKNDIVMQVKNMGEPIPEEETEKIFERFYRIDKSRNRSEKRYGLGLAIAKSTVQKYNGKIEVSCKDGITIFRVSIQM